MPIAFELNGKQTSVDVNPETPLLWVLRDTLNLTGTKYGCGIAQCGSCTVHIDGEAQRSCVISMSDVAGKKVMTIDGLSVNHSHPVQLAWIAEQAPQCGYCQSGQIMTAVAFLQKHPHPTPTEVEAAMSDNICRCGTALRIKKAVLRAATSMNGEGAAKSAGGAL
ncbi:MAG: (2Fe-2S)-binding protein [Bryobacteraceae bacterium]